MSLAPVEAMEDDSLALKGHGGASLSPSERNEVTNGDQATNHCSAEFCEPAESGGVAGTGEASHLELPGSVSLSTSGISLGNDNGTGPYIKRTETSSSDMLEVECEQDSALIRRHMTYGNRLESQVYAEVNKPDPRELDAAVRVLESKSFRALPSMKDVRKDSAETESPYAPSGLSGFYEKLLGGDWKDQLQQIDKEEVNNIYASGHASRSNSAGELLILSGGGANHQGKFRQRIRRRDAPQNKDMNDEVSDDLQFGGGDEPLITADEIAEVRRNAWTPAGESIPPLASLGLEYNQAWDIGKRGCLATKINGAWSATLVAKKKRFFVMDGTDPEAFLTYYNGSDLQALQGLSPEKLGSISAWDLRNGHWSYKKTRVFFRRSDKQNKDCVLGNFSSAFYNAMLVCLWNMEVQFKIEKIKNKRREESSRRRQSRSQASPAASTTARQSVSLVRYATQANQHVANSLRRRGSPQKSVRQPKPSVVSGLAEGIRSMSSKDCVAAWVEARSLGRLAPQDRKHVNTGPSSVTNETTASSFSTVSAYQRSRQKPVVEATLFSTEGVETPYLSPNSPPSEMEEQPFMFG